MNILSISIKKSDNNNSSPNRNCHVDNINNYENLCNIRVNCLTTVSDIESPTILQLILCSQNKTNSHNCKYKLIIKKVTNAKIVQSDIFILKVDSPYSHYFISITPNQLTEGFYVGEIIQILNEQNNDDVPCDNTKNGSNMFQFQKNNCLVGLNFLSSDKFVFEDQCVLNCRVNSLSDKVCSFEAIRICCTRHNDSLKLNKIFIGQRIVQSGASVLNGLELSRIDLCSTTCDDIEGTYDVVIEILDCYKNVLNSSACFKSFTIK